MQRGFQRLAKLTLEEVLPHLAAAKTTGQRHEFHGQSVSVASTRLRCFAAKGTRCVTCGLEGSFFALEKAPGQIPYHLNLYALNAAGEEVLMTRDHIHPQSKGGTESLSNAQTMCQPCNLGKADAVESPPCSSCVV